MDMVSLFKTMQQSCSYHHIHISTMSSNKNTICKLPTELLDRVVGYLDYNTTKYLRHMVAGTRTSYNACDSEVHQPLFNACTRRMSVYAYLQDNFGRSDELLEAMSKATAYLSGSRAVEFFAPGSCEPTSDWDFYVPLDVGTMLSFMCKLETMGVSWKTHKDLFGINIENKPEGFAVSSYDLLRIKAEGAREEATRRGFRFEIHGFDDTERGEWFYASVNDGAVIVKPHHEGPIEYEEHVCTIVAKGYVSRNGVDMQVQILGEQRRSDFYTPSIFGHHSSCTQAVISPYMAFHIYGDITCNYKSYPWPDVLTRKDIHVSWTARSLPEPRDKCVPVWMKYEGRGYTYIDAPCQGTLMDMRRIQNGGVIKVEYSRHTSAPALVINYYRSMLENMVWVQRSGMVVDMSSSEGRYSWLKPDPLVEEWLDNLDLAVHRERMRKYSHVLV